MGLSTYFLFWRLDSGNSTSHIRFDSEESDEETVDQQQEDCSMKDITDGLNSLPPSANISASEQNHQASSERAASESKVMQNLRDNGMISDFLKSCSELSWSIVQR